MKMGIERALKAAFGDSLKEIVQVRFTEESCKHGGKA
jgi:hypothetical protein